VESEAGQLRAADCGREDTVAEVVVVEDVAGGRREDESEVVRFAREELAAEDANSGAREVDATTRGARLHGHKFAGVRAVLDRDRLGLEVEVAVAEREQLALAE